MTSRNVRTSAGPRAGVVALAVAGVFLLAGCSGGAPADPGTGSPSASESASPSPSATPTPTPSAVYKPADATGPAQNVPVPVLPEVAKTETKEGLEAFVRYWYQVLDYSYQTGDSTILQKISGPACVFCAGLGDGIAESWKDGRWISGGRVETPVITGTLEPGKEPYAVVQVIQAIIEIRNADGSLHQAPTPATNTGSRAAVKFDGNSWILTDLGLIR
ncbi:conserved hypothetical protein [Pseudarthrobacter chlorophenolicus A6]|uniref:DUF6318 domain-containing protein n=1 Tax=Pseudarthrobacter chlorophenolicus (strain ATCC 700700 / DSM 12829 / CIP 107037 / JCM 12360 / KCTC 9906 / NCIMB 13794 / A6) TaxID=452863 RepID=B8HDH6_PSECP|nr:DUF6318 family protein [Pseudarthrobacter chlorophenolicus]ACL38981.1 conserved hypothetical protein [Pseudarthrobacter chlorophenolicus A6]SDR06082.1 hypothetical protein SAMN04489738_4543 [Pseudarthrobacter chlorophenolicus]